MFRRTTATIVWIAAVTIGLTRLGAVEVVFAQQMELTEEQFNQWLTNGRSSPQLYFESQLNGRLDRLEKTCELTADQRQKLELAGRGDIQRFQTELSRLHDELVGQKFDQNRINDVYERLQPFAERVRRGILDDGSLFQKVFASSLDNEQQRAYERAEAERISYQYNAKAKLFVAMLDNNAPMLSEQREAVLALLLKTTRPPKRWVSRYEWYYVLFHASKTPRDELGRILDAAQLRCFDAVVAQGARYGSMLNREGMVPVEDDAPTDNDGKKPAAAPDAIPELQIGG